jgi:hypothetical protein
MIVLLLHIYFFEQVKLMFLCLLFSLFTNFQIQLVLGDESSISVGWQKKDEKSTATGEVKVVSLRSQPRH